MRGLPPSLAFCVAAGAAAVVSLGAGAATGPAATAQQICARIQADVGRTAYLHAYPASGDCRASMALTAASANRLCLRKGKSGSVPWRRCLAAKVVATATAEERAIAIHVPATTSAAPAAQPPVTTSPGPIDVVGTVTFLTSSALTVGVVTCALDASSPGLAAFPVGSRADMLCQDGVVRRVGMPPP